MADGYDSDDWYEGGYDNSGSYYSGKSSSNNQVARVGLIQLQACHDEAPRNQGSRSIAQRESFQSPHSSITGQYGRNSQVVQDNISTMRHEDGGRYGYARARERVIQGEPVRDRSSGQTGFKDEVLRTSKVKVGDQSGYTEYYDLQRIRRVDYDKSSRGGGSSSSSKSIGYNYKKY